MPTQTTLKQFIKNNVFYQNFIRPIRVKWKEKALAKLDDQSYFTKRHKTIFGYTPDFRNPKTFNEKIIHRILFDRNPIYTSLADKLKARIYIASILEKYNATQSLDNVNMRWGGGQLHSQKDKSKTSLDLSLILNSHSPLFQPIDTLTQALFDTNACPYLPKLYGIYKNTQEIDFSKLPKSFVLKTNHDCGGVILVPNKDIFLTNSKTFQESMDKLTQHLHTNYYLLHREWHYKDIEPRVFVEEILGEIEGEEWKAPTDYKIHCFKDCAYMQIDIDRFTNHTRVIFDEDWNPMPFSFLYPISQSIPNKPYNAEMMFAIAKALAGRFYMRVDLYNIYGRIVVGELTFTHGGGTETFNPKEWDKKFGDLWI